WARTLTKLSRGAHQRFACWGNTETTSLCGNGYILEQERVIPVCYFAKEVSCSVLKEDGTYMVMPLFSTSSFDSFFFFFFSLCNFQIWWNRVKLVEHELWQLEEKGLIGILPVQDVAEARAKNTGRYIKCHSTISNHLYYDT
ncbi:hypothetical protein DVH24_034662, partial [Malus domestica]